MAKTPDGPAATEFPADTPNFYVRWRGANLPTGSVVRFTWVAEDVGDIVDPNFIVDQKNLQVNTPNVSGRFTLSRPPDGWAPGKYRVDLYLDDRLTSSLAITIQE